MTMFDPVPIPTWNSLLGAQATVRQVDGWLASPPMLALARTYGEDLEGVPAPTAALRLETLAAANWDFRKGKERDTAARVEIDANQTDLIVAAATALGLVQSTPPLESEYDALLVLGGLIRACMVRPRYAAELLRDGLVAKEIVALGAFRPLSDPELQLADDLGVTVTDEFEAMTAGVRHALGNSLVEPPIVTGQELPNDPARSWRDVSWQTHEIGGGALRQVRVVAAPTVRAQAARANTTETYQFWAQTLKAEDIRSVLVITNPIYVAYQGCAAILALGLAEGLDVETVGVSRESADLGTTTQPFGAQEYLQELRSAIESMIKLRTALDTPRPGSQE